MCFAWKGFLLLCGIPPTVFVHTAFQCFLALALPSELDGRGGVDGSLDVLVKGLKQPTLAPFVFQPLLAHIRAEREKDPSEWQ